MGGADKTNPDTGYKSDSTFRDSAPQFQKAVGESAAFKAYFAGSIAFDEKDESILLVGPQQKK